MRKQDEDVRSMPGGRAAQRLRDFLRQRQPPGAPSERPAPESGGEPGHKDGSQQEKGTTEKADTDDSGTVSNP